MRRLVFPDRDRKGKPGRPGEREEVVYREKGGQWETNRDSIGCGEAKLDTKSLGGGKPNGIRGWWGIAKTNRV